MISVAAEHHAAPAFRTIGEEITVNQATVDAVRKAAESHGDLVAFAQLPQGVHPFMVVAFIERGESVELLMTSVYWGRIQGKWQVLVDLATSKSIVQVATTTFDCSRGPVIDFLFGTALIYWENGTQTQITCLGGWGTEQGATFGARVQSILDLAVATYEPL